MTTQEDTQYGPLRTKFEQIAAKLEAVRTIPRPYELYYAVKNMGPGAGWRYHVVGIGVNEIRAAADALKTLDELICKLKEITP